MTKAKTRAEKRRRGGRPLKPNAKRTPDGRLSRSNDVKDAETRLLLEVATWKRRQRLDEDGCPFIDESIPVTEAAKQHYGSVIHAWKEAHDRFKAKHDDTRINPMSFTAQHLQTAQTVQSAYENYRHAIASRNPRSASDFSAPGGFDGTDPFDEDREKRDKVAIEKWKAIRSAILNSGPLGMMAVETIIFENTAADSLIGDLRLALNAVDRMTRIARAA